jgi:hypothetical protein
MDDSGLGMEINKLNSDILGFAKKSHSKRKNAFLNKENNITSRYVTKMVIREFM